MKRTIYILLLILLPVGVMANDTIPVQPKAVLEFTREAGDKAYRQEQYGDAVEIYEGVIKDNGATMQLYYNLGNAYFRLGNKGKAILNYERALKLDPLDEDTKANLEYVVSLTEDEVIEEPELFFVTWWHSFVNVMSVDVWAIAGVSSFIGLLVGLALFLVSRNSAVRKFGLVVMPLSLLITLSANLAAFSMYSRVTDDSQAIVLGEEVSLMSAPGATTVLTKVHEGRKVTIIDESVDRWFEIELEDGTVGWVKGVDIERI